MPSPSFADIWDEIGCGEPDADEMAGIGDYIRQLVAVDPDSYRFRVNLLAGGAATSTSTLELPEELFPDSR
jgi:hypothetical protein